MLDEIDSAEYVVNRHSKKVMEEMLNGMCADGSIFKEFEGEIDPLCHVSRSLREISKWADGLADKVKEESLDIARALLIDLPTQPRDPRLRDK